MNKTLSVVSSADAPKALGPYSQAIKASGFIFVSGQIPIRPTSGELVTGAISLQTEVVLTNISEILKAAGSSLSRVVKTTVFLQNMDDFEEMNNTYSKFFCDTKPARSTVQVVKLPKNVAIEIECVALE